MAISNVIKNSKIEKDCHGRFIVVHPSNSAILAYCDTEQEALDFCDMLYKLATVNMTVSSTDAFLKTIPEGESRVFTLHDDSGHIYECKRLKGE